VSRTRPDVVLMDVRMPVVDGIAATISSALTKLDLTNRIQLALLAHDADDA
jgi:DNA-binding NarL/FixJ family response regulator